MEILNLIIVWLNFVLLSFLGSKGEFWNVNEEKFTLERFIYLQVRYQAEKCYRYAVASRSTAGRNFRGSHHVEGKLIAHVS